MKTKKYHYCIMRQKLNAKPEYADGFLIGSFWQPLNYTEVRAELAALQDPPWALDEFVIISLNQIE